MTDWLTIRVVLVQGREEPVEDAPGRMMLVHADHTFSELAEAIDTAFGRWDLAPVHEFDVEGRRLLLGGAPEEESDETEDTEDVTVGEVGLRIGARFAYIFDPLNRWIHDCSVFSVDVDPFDLIGEEPDRPTAMLGWGTIPDQYGRIREDDDLATEPASDPSGQLAGWTESESASWEIVSDALADVPRPLPEAQLAAAATQARAHREDDTWPWDVLWAASGFEPEDPCEDDEELWVELAAAVVAPRGELPLDPERESAWASLEPADWAGAVIELVRGGRGQEAGSDVVLELVVACPEVDNGELTDEDEQVLLAGFETVVELWQALGIVDDELRLTALGCWGLPEALQLAWTEP